MGVGTPALVRDIYPGAADSTIGELAAFDGRLYFSADDGASGRELWRSDGTTAGTGLFMDISPGPGSSFPVGMTDAFGELIFRASDPVHGAEPRASDGTVAGTAVVDINPGAGGSSPSNLTLADDRTYFRASDDGLGDELWVYEGAPAAVRLVDDIGDPGLQGPMVAAGDTVYFGGDDGTGHKLWKSDGTASGTMPISDDVFVTLTPLLASGGKLFFAGLTVGAGTELWVSDGTDAGTKLVENIAPGDDGSLPDEMVDLDGTILFMADDGAHGREPWTTEGTPEGTKLIEDVNPGSPSSNIPGGAGFVVVGDTAYFGANDAAHGRELWRSDGSPGGTELVEDIRPGSSSSSPAFLRQIDGRVFFTASDGAYGFEPWLTDDDGTDADMVADIAAGTADSTPSDFTRVGGNVFFVASTEAAGGELWSVPLDAPAVAVDDSATVAEDAPATAIPVLANDTDADGGAPKSVASVTQPANGKVAIAGGGSGLTYEPDPGYCNDGAPTDDFTYVLSPGGDTASVRMTVACDSPPSPPGKGDPPPARPAENPAGSPAGTAAASRVAIVRKGVARLLIRCADKGACKGRATLAVTVRRGKRAVRVVLGAKRFTIPAGKSKTLRIQLNRAGRSRLVKSHSGRLRVKLAGAGIKSRTVVLKAD